MNEKHLLWLFTPDYNKFGRISEIKWVPNIVKNLTTKQIEPSPNNKATDEPYPGADIFWQ